MSRVQQAQIRKLQLALNNEGQRITLSSSQFWSKDMNRTITIWSIKQAFWDEDKNKFVYVKLFESSSQIQIVLFLRDLWFKHKNMDLPMDNEYWNKIREKIERENGIVEM